MFQVEKLKKTIENLESKNLKLQSQIKDKNKVINDIMTLNMELQSQVINEYPKLHKINEDIQAKVLSHFDELMCK